jgi:hypothetical protein
MEIPPTGDLQLLSCWVKTFVPKPNVLKKQLEPSAIHNLRFSLKPFDTAPSDGFGF